MSRTGHLSPLTLSSLSQVVVAQAAADEGEERLRGMVTAASTGLKNHSRWLLVFEDVGTEVDIMKLLEGTRKFEISKHP